MKQKEKKVFFEQNWLEWCPPLTKRSTKMLAWNIPAPLLSTLYKELHVSTGWKVRWEFHFRPAFPFFTGTSVTFPPDFLALASACRSTDIATCCWSLFVLSSVKCFTSNAPRVKPLATWQVWQQDGIFARIKTEEPLSKK